MKLGMTPKNQLKPGSLIVVDQFQPAMPIMTGFGGGFSQPAETPHGQLVKASAEDAGFKGNLVPSPNDIHFTDNPFETRNRQLAFLMMQKDIKPEEYKSMLGERAEVAQISLLHKTSERLQGLTEAGTKNSAVNFSQGSSKASSVMSAYTGALMSPESLDNAARAFGLSSEKLSSQDPKVSGPERAKLHQGMTDLISQRLDSSKPLQLSRQNYDKSVRDFESHNNSVVVSAGNEGDVAASLKQDAGGHGIRVPKDFEDNILVNSQVTAVGALEGEGKASKVAAYSSRIAEVDVYAKGTITDPLSPDRPTQGTSFAAPRVAAAMATLHGKNPTMTSAQVEGLLKKQLGMNVSGASVPVLDLDKTRAFLGSQSF